MPIPFTTLLTYDSSQCDVCLVFSVYVCMCVYICVNLQFLCLCVSTIQVREAIHVKPESEIGPWHVCTNKISYESTVASLLPAYPTLM